MTLRIGNLRTWLVCGFALGVLVTLPAAFLALSTPVGETLYPVLVAGGTLLRPLAPVLAGWSDVLDLMLIAAANGVVYSLAAGALRAAVGVARNR